MGARFDRALGTARKQSKAGLVGISKFEPLECRFSPIEVLRELAKMKILE
jgi:hypothetical protein